MIVKTPVDSSDSLLRRLITACRDINVHTAVNKLRSGGLKLRAAGG